MKRAIVALSLSLAGCVTAAADQQHLQEQKYQFAIAKKDCITTNKTWFARVHCANSAENRILGYETPLMAWKHTEFLRVALKLDKGYIGKEQAAIENREIWTQARQRAEQIGAQRQAAEDDRRALLIGIGAALLANSQPPAPVPPPPQIQLQCNRKPLGMSGMTCLGN